MAITLTKSVVFGKGQASLATVGYALINPDGTVNTARAITGVVENPTASGNYQAPITFAAPFSGTIRWDTGTGTPVYAIDEINNKDFTVPDATGRVTVGTNADKAGYALTAAEHTAIQADANAAHIALGYTAARGTKLDNLDATVSSRNAGAVTLTAGEHTNVQADAAAALAAVNVTAARGLKLDNLDATVSSRNTGAVALTSAEHTAVQADAAAALTAAGYTGARSVKIDNLDALVSTRATPAQVATQVGATPVSIAVTGLDAMLTDVATDADARSSGFKMLRALFNRFYNRVTQTATVQVVSNDAGATISSMATSDDGTTATKAKSA